MESEYEIKEPKMVASRLNDIIKNRCIITAYFCEEEFSYLTCIVSVDTQKHLVEIDCAPSESLNAKLLASPNVLFCTEFDGVNVSFTGHGIKKINTGSGGSSFVMPLPDSIFWMQRRQCFRMKLPQQKAECAIELTVNSPYQDETGNHIGPRLMRFKLVDISISGFAFHNFSPVVPNYLLPATQYHSCLLRLDEKQDNSARISFQIINNNKIRSNQLSTVQRIGCRFTDFPAGFDAVLWRYIQNSNCMHVA